MTDTPEEARDREFSQENAYTETYPDRDVRREPEAFDRLTGLCKIMTDALEDALEVEREEARGGPEPEDVRAAVFLDTERVGGIQLHGWDDDTDAMAALFLHMQAIFRANGRDIQFIGIPDSPEDLEV